MIQELGFPFTMLMWVREAAVKPEQYGPYYLTLQQGRYGAGTPVRCTIFAQASAPPLERGDCVLIHVNGEETKHSYNENTGATIYRHWVAHRYKKLTPEQADAYEDMQDSNAAESRSTIQAIHEMQEKRAQELIEA